MKFKCSKCGKLEDLYALYCPHSGRGANGLCGAHDYSGLLCKDCYSPYHGPEEKLNAIENEIKTYYDRRMTTVDYQSTAWVTIELIEKILDCSYFKEKDVE